MPTNDIVDELSQAIHAGLKSDAWTDSEKWVLKWQWQGLLGLLGDFEMALAKAIVLADDDNLARLRRGFPIQVDGFLSWSRGDLARRLRAAGVMD